MISASHERKRSIATGHVAPCGHLGVPLLDDGHAGDAEEVVPHPLLQLLQVQEVDLVDDLGHTKQSQSAREDEHTG
jgi:hypothetical protein